MTRYNAAIIDTAGQFLGLKEIPGLKHNAEILKMFEVSGHGWVEDDETPWCAAFCNMVLATLGLPHPGSLRARDYDSYGAHVELEDALPGDIVRLWRNTPSSGEGHVAFLVRMEGDRVLLRGGNQGNEVSDDWYSVNRVHAVRRADGKAARATRPVLRMGSRGAFVTDLQDQLVSLGYFVGQVDGVFGSRTRESVQAFQADHKLTLDGVVGDQTWEALETARPRPKRDITMDDLHDSRTIRDANRINTAAGTVAGVAGAGTVVEVINAAQQVADSESLIQTIGRIVAENWWVIAIVVAAFLIWHYGRQIKRIRLEDARSGAHLGR